MVLFCMSEHKIGDFQTHVTLATLIRFLNSLVFHDQEEKIYKTAIFYKNLRRWVAWPGSVDMDPMISNNKLKKDFERFFWIYEIHVYR